MSRVVAAVLLALITLPGERQSVNALETLPFAPRRAIAYRASPAPSIDGRLDDAAWRAAAWSEEFVDIEGDSRPRPRLQTRVKMLWDDHYFYVGADLAETDLWATYAERESIIFRENDFEVFIDPDGDTHEYYELEINALNTVWDLMLVKPYRDGGPAVNAWDIRGLKTAVHLRGTRNRPGDRDDGWSVEIALPWKILEEAAPGQRPPKAGEQWRVNFSRVQWALDVKDGKYTKRTNEKGQPLAENNWVWSPQGAINMHMPERWGYVQFSARLAADGTEPFFEAPDEQVKWALRRIYYRQADFLKANGRYARSTKELGVEALAPAGFQLHATDHLYVMTAPGSGGVVHLRQDGKVWTLPR